VRERREGLGGGGAIVESRRGDGEGVKVEDGLSSTSRSLKVGKCNAGQHCLWALAAQTPVRQRALYPHSPRGLVTRLEREREGGREGAVVPLLFIERYQRAYCQPTGRSWGGRGGEGGTRISQLVTPD